jgi:hypothetical protein
MLGRPVAARLTNDFGRRTNQVQQDNTNTHIQIFGGLLCLVGVLGTFLHISQNDGAIAIVGAIIFASGTIAKSLMK